MEDRCVCCGAIIPEGRQVCEDCERGKDKLNPCNCDCPMTMAWKSFFLGIPISTTIMCVFCRRKVTRFTEKQAVKAWNRRTGK